MLSEKTIFRSAFWMGLSAILEHLELFIIAIIIANSFPRFLGRFYFSLLLFHVLGVLLGRLLSTRITPKLREGVDATFAAYSIKIFFLAGILLSLSFYPILIAGSYLLGHPAIGQLLSIFAFATPFFLLSLIFSNILRLLQKFKELVFLQVIGQYGIQLILIFLFVKVFGFSINSLAWANFLGILIFDILASIILIKEINLLGFFQKIKLSEFTPRFTGMATSFLALSIRMAELLIPLIIGFKAFGNYIKLVYWPLLLYTLPTAIFSMFIHIASIKVGRGEKIRELTLKTTYLMAAVTIPALLIVLIFPEQLTDLLFRSAPISVNTFAIRVFAFSFFIKSFTWIIGRSLIASKKLNYYLIPSYIFIVILVALVVVLVPGYGQGFEINGIAVSFLAASIIEFLLEYGLLLRSKII